MWEFLSRKKEVSVAAPEPIAAASEKKETAPATERVIEQATEKVNEKYAAILTQVGPVKKAVTRQDVKEDAERIGQVTDAATQVNQLVELAQMKGVSYAVQVARRMNDLYVLDTMHDELADKFYEALKQKGLLSAE